MDYAGIIRQSNAVRGMLEEHGLLVRLDGLRPVTDPVDDIIEEYEKEIAALKARIAELGAR